MKMREIRKFRSYYYKRKEKFERMMSVSLVISILTGLASIPFYYLGFNFIFVIFHVASMIFAALMVVFIFFTGFYLNKWDNLPSYYYEILNEE